MTLATMTRTRFGVARKVLVMVMWRYSEPIDITPTVSVSRYAVLSPAVYTVEIIVALSRPGNRGLALLGPPVLEPGRIRANTTASAAPTKRIPIAMPHHIRVV